MKTMFRWSLTMAAVALLVWGCSKEKPETDPNPKTDTEQQADSTLNLDALVADTLSADSLARLEAERLEAERARLEEMINRIMSDDVYFDYDRSELTEKAKVLLAQVAEILINENRFVVIIEGHTDARGTEDYNISLGARRSMAVREFLIAYGVDGKRLVPVSYGKERPKVQGTDESAYSQNRRAHFRVTIE
ncbi:MAG: OmpA family protein [Fibrobacter sp.]|nr:OmpA family protein [Fibrobacter sp.]MBR6854108.1 OmpA family protein [Fibrobacter sp.]